VNFKEDFWKSFCHLLRITLRPEIRGLAGVEFPQYDENAVKILKYGIGRKK